MGRVDTMIGLLAVARRRGRLDTEVCPQGRDGGRSAAIVVALRPEAYGQPHQWQAGLTHRGARAPHTNVGVAEACRTHADLLWWDALWFCKTPHIHSHSAWDSAGPWPVAPVFTTLARMMHVHVVDPERHQEAVA